MKRFGQTDLNHLSSKRTMSFNTLRTPGNDNSQKRRADDQFVVKVTGGRSNSSSHEDVAQSLKRSGFLYDLTESSVIPTATSATYRKFRLKRNGMKKTEFFKYLRRKWCSFITKSVPEFWLESEETPESTFEKSGSIPGSQNLPIKSFSLGSFYNRGTFIEHYTSDSDLESIKDMTVECEHDLKKMAIVFSHQFGLRGFNIIMDEYENRVEFEYKQFEEFVLVDENRDEGRIDIYFPLQWPGKVSKEEKNGERSNFIRQSKLLSCGREVLGQSSVLRLRFEFADDKEAIPPIQLAAKLGKLGKAKQEKITMNPPYF